MTSAHQNQPTIPRLQINLDEILGTIALELARVHGVFGMRQPVDVHPCLGGQVLEVPPQGGAGVGLACGQAAGEP